MAGYTLYVEWGGIQLLTTMIGQIDRKDYYRMVEAQVSHLVDLLPLPEECIHSKQQTPRQVKNT